MNDKKMDDMKRDYRQIGIPEQLRPMVLNTIKEAKSERSVIFYMKKIGIRTLQAVAGILVCITVAANSSANVAHAMEKIPVLGAITRVVTFRNYEVKNDNMEANIKVPKIEETTEGGSQNEAVQQLNKSVQEYTDEIIAKFEADMKEFSFNENGEGMHEAVDTDYEVITDNDRLFSLRINTTIATGGSINISKIYHMDKKTDTVIGLKDLFVEGSDYITVLTDLVKEQMRSNMEKDENILYFIDSKDGMEEFDFKQIREDQNFYFDDNGILTLVFDEYEVAPGYMGIVEIKLPADVINGNLKPDFQ